MSLNAEWNKMAQILAINEDQFKNKILPRNMLTQEMIENITRQIQRIKTSLVMRRRNLASYQKIENKLNHLSMDMYTAAKISGLQHVLVFSSQLS
jgi:hypothetical protein